MKNNQEGFRFRRALPSANRRIDGPLIPIGKTKVPIDLENGSEVWSSHFASIRTGDTVQFTATFEASYEPQFAFFKRTRLVEEDQPQPNQGETRE